MAEDSESKFEGVSQKSEQELVKLCKRRFENWREVLIHLNSVLTWEESFFPGLIAVVVTFVFLMLWYFDPSVLTALSIFGILACVLDYAVPILSDNFFDSSKWTGTKERKYEDICHGFVDNYLKAKYIWDSTRQIKESKPYLYFVGVVGTLIFMAWIGNLFDNLFLTYLIVLFTSLMPGIKNQHIVQKNITKVMALIKSLTGQDKKKN